MEAARRFVMTAGSCSFCAKTVSEQDDHHPDGALATMVTMRVATSGALLWPLLGCGRISFDVQRELELVTTVGNLTVHPNIVNAIPGKVTLSIDMRDPHTETLGRALPLLDRAVKAACEREGVRYELEIIPVNTMDEVLAKALATKLGCANGRVPRERSAAA